MKTKILFAGLLLAGLAANAQLVETAIETGVGLQNGAARGTGVSDATPGSTFLGYQAGYTTDGKQSNGPNNTFVGNQTGYSNTLGSENAYFGGLAGFSGNNALTAKNTFIGFKAGYTNLLGANNTFTGWQSGLTNKANNNTFYGSQSGQATSTGSVNVFIGASAGISNTQGSSNLFAGYQAGYSNTTGNDQVYLGVNAGYYNTSPSGNNVFVGASSGTYSGNGYGNTYIGAQAGLSATGSENVFLGVAAGANESGNHRLYIANSNTTTPLIKGEFDNKRLTFNGKVSITSGADQAALFPANAGSVSVGNYYLFVKGGILTEEVRVHLKASGGWADYVFADDYKLKPLSEVEKYISENGHLPNIPSAKELAENGLELGGMANLQQEKIEELTLYAIQQDKQLTAQQTQMEKQNNLLEQQQKEIDELKAAVKALVAKQ